MGEGKKRTLLYQFGFLAFTVLGSIMNVKTIIDRVNSAIKMTYKDFMQDVIDI